MILADTSAWVEFDRATGSAVDRRLTGLLEDDGPLAVTEPVVMEVVVGARTDGDGAALRRLLERPTLLPFDPAADFDAAARIFRLCRRAGVTPAGMTRLPHRLGRPAARGHAVGGGCRRQPDRPGGRHRARPREVRPPPTTGR